MKNDDLLVRLRNFALKATIIFTRRSPMIEIHHVPVLHTFDGILRRVCPKTETFSVPRRHSPYSSLDIFSVFRVPSEVIDIRYRSTTIVRPSFAATGMIGPTYYST